MHYSDMDPFNRYVSWSHFPPNPFVYEIMQQTNLDIENLRTWRMKLDVAPINIPDACLCGHNQIYREFDNIKDEQTYARIKFQRPIVKLNI